MLKRPNLKNSLVISSLIHILTFTLFSIATFKEFYPQPKYLEVSLASPGARLIYPHPLPPMRKAGFTSSGENLPPFFYIKRRASLEITLSPSRDRKEGIELADFPDHNPPLEEPNGVRILRISSPEYLFWNKRLAIEDQVKLRIRLSPDGRVRLVTMDSSSGSPQLDSLIKEIVSHWQFERHD